MFCSFYLLTNLLFYPGKIMILFAAELSRHCPGFKIFVESNQDTLYHKLNTRRLGLTLIPKVVTMTNFSLRWPTRADLIYWKNFFFSHFITCIASSSGNSGKTGPVFLMMSLLSWNSDNFPIILWCLSFLIEIR